MNLNLKRGYHYAWVVGSILSHILSYYMLGGQRTGTGSKSEQAAVRSALNEDDIFDENQKILLGYQDDFLDN